MTNNDTPQYTNLRMTRRGKILYILFWIVSATLIGWNLDFFVHGWWVALDTVLHTILDIAGALGKWALR